MRKYQQNQRKRTSPFLHFAADNSEEVKDIPVKTDHDQLKFGRSKVLYQIVHSLFITIHQTHYLMKNLIGREQSINSQ